MSGYITEERSRDPQFILALIRGETPPGVEPGSPEDIELRGISDDAASVVDAAPPMTAEQVVTIAALLSRPA
jgi:hypothetical protein